MVRNHKSMRFVSNLKIEVPSKIFAPWLGICIYTPNAKLFNQPPRNIVSEATSVDEIGLVLGGVKGATLARDNRSTFVTTRSAH